MVIREIKLKLKQFNTVFHQQTGKKEITENNQS